MNFQLISRFGTWVMVTAPQVFAWDANAATANAITDFKGKWVGLKDDLVIFKRDDRAEVQVSPPDEALALQFAVKGDMTEVTLFKPLGYGAKLSGRHKQFHVPGIDPQTNHDKEQTSPGKLGKGKSTKAAKAEFTGSATKKN